MRGEGVPSAYEIFTRSQIRIFARDTRPAPSVVSARRRSNSKDAGAQREARTRRGADALGGASAPFFVSDVLSRIRRRRHALAFTPAPLASRSSSAGTHRGAWRNRLPRCRFFFY